MVTKTLIIYFILSILFVSYTLWKVYKLKNEKHLDRERIKVICHDFKISLTTLNLTVESLKDYEKLTQIRNQDGGGLPSLLEILDDVGQNIGKSINKLIQQTKHK